VTEECRRDQPNDVGLVRPARFARTTSWFVAATGSLNTANLLAQLCPATRRLPREGLSPIAKGRGELRSFATDRRRDIENPSAHRWLRLTGVDQRHRFPRARVQFLVGWCFEQGTQIRQEDP